MRIKKIIFAIFCAAILVGTGVVCLVYADDGGISAYSVSTYNEGDVVYNNVRLRAFGNSSAPASITQIVNPSTNTTSYFGEVDVSRRDVTTGIYEDSDGDNAVVRSGKVLTGQIGQVRDKVYYYEHYAVLHYSDVLASPVAKTLYRDYKF